MRLLKIVAGGLLAVGIALVPSAAAHADEALPAPEVAWVNDNVIVTGANGEEATLLAKYRCYGGETGTHLWASIKQGGEDLEGEHSSARATSWYDTNYQWANDPAGQTINCDGHWHATRFTVKLVEGWQPLTAGPAWVQFCVFDSSATEDNFPTGFAYSYGWMTVRAANAS